MKEIDIRPADLFNEFLKLSVDDINTFFADKSLFKHVRCPGCDSNVSHHGLTKYDFTYLQCLECGSLYCSPRPNIGQLEEFYQNAKSVEFWATHFYQETADARKKLMFRPRAMLAADLFSENVWIDQDVELLDIGSGYGMFLDEVKRIGKFNSIVGIEPNKQFAQICRERGFHIINKYAEDITADDVSANIATCFEVLEHVYDPCTFLRKVQKALCVGGKLLLTTLTANGFDIQVLWQHSKSLTPPHHLNILSVEGMRHLFERSGYRILEIETPGKLDVDIVLNAYKENNFISESRFVNLLIAQNNEKTNNAFQRFLQQNNLSSHIQVVAERL